jgi:hypothetical protein
MLSLRTPGPLLAGALALASLPSAAADGGKLVIYLRPLPAESVDAGLRFRLAAAEAYREDGSSEPLRLHAIELPAEGSPRTTLLATGELPRGAYAGLRLQAASANRRGPEGHSPLRIAESAPLIPFEFVADGSRPVLATLTLLHRDASLDGTAFAPAFAASRPPRPSVEALGAVSLPDADLVALFDRTSGDVVDLVATAPGPRGLEIDRLRRRAYVACAREETLEAIDLADGRVLVSRRLRVGDDPAAVAVSPDSAIVLVVNSGSSTVALFDAPSLTERARVKVGNRPSYAVIAGDGRRAFVFDEMADAISVLDIATGSVIGAAVSEGGPYRGALDRSGERLYVVHRASPYVDALDPETLESVARVYVGPGATAITVDPRRDKIHVALATPPRIEVFDALSLLPSETIAAPAAVGVLAADAREYNLCMALPTRRALRIVRLVGQRPVADVELPGEPEEVVYVRER